MPFNEVQRLHARGRAHVEAREPVTGSDVNGQLLSRLHRSVHDLGGSLHSFACVKIAVVFLNDRPAIGQSTIQPTRLHVTVSAAFSCPLNLASFITVSSWCQAVTSFTYVPSVTFVTLLL